MKTRKCFVANSSSSSFVCDLCGEEFTGWDACPSEFDHCECENDHTICNEGIVGELEEDEDRYEIPASHCPFCLFMNFTDHDMKMFLQAKYKVNPDVVFAEVKEANRRRKKLYDHEYVSYIYRVCNTNSTAEEADIKNTFKLFNDFRTWCIDTIKQGRIPK